MAIKAPEEIPIPYLVDVPILSKDAISFLDSITLESLSAIVGEDKLMYMSTSNTEHVQVGQFTNNIQVGLGNIRPIVKITHNTEFTMNNVYCSKNVISNHTVQGRMIEQHYGSKIKAKYFLTKDVNIVSDDDELIINYFYFIDGKLQREASFKLDQASFKGFIGEGNENKWVTNIFQRKVWICTTHSWGAIAYMATRGFGRVSPKVTPPSKMKLARGYTNHGQWITTLLKFFRVSGFSPIGLFGRQTKMTEYNMELFFSMRVPLLKLFARLGGVPKNELIFLELDASNKIVHCSYTSMPRSKINVDGIWRDAVGIEKKVLSKNHVTTIRSFLDEHGQLLLEIELGSELYAMIPGLQNIESVSQYFVDESKMMKKFDWEQDLEMISLFDLKKERIAGNLLKYNYKNPEWRYLIADFLQQLLIDKPSNVIEYAIKHFTK